MLRTYIRLLAAALLAVAIPIQGMSAVMAGQCMALGHHQDGGGQEKDGHGHDGADGHDPAAHAHADESGTKQADEGGKKPHCGPCAACCASASIAAGPAGVPLSSSPSHAKYVFSQSPPLGVLPHGLDRPPLAL